MAAQVVGAAGGAAGVFQASRESAIVGDGAARSGVEGDIVGGLVVGAFENIDFATVGPVGAYHPECWPERGEMVS